jgi:CobQ-like glutamine amidotransferase family enzyme
VAERTLRVCALYPDLMNIYADRGNLLLLERRCAWRGIGFELTGAGLGDEIDADAHDLFYLGGGQDRDQALCAQDLATVKRDALHAAAARGAVVFGVCGGYQLLGDGYAMGGERLPGVGLVDLDTVREEGPRLIGNVAIELDLDGGPSVLAGFENHGGRTKLGADTEPLGRVLRGHGNDGRSGHEGVRGGPRGTVIGTYLHGPLLPKNAWFADWLAATAMGIAPDGLEPLDDALEDAAHAAARRAAGISARVS